MKTWSAMPVLCLLLAACGSGGSDSVTPSSSQDDQPPTTMPGDVTPPGNSNPGNDPPTVDPGNNPGTTPSSYTADIAGFWLGSDEGLQVYSLVSTDGKLTNYEENPSLNCFNRVNTTLQSLGGDQYRETDSIDGGFDDFRASIVNGNLQVNRTEEGMAIEETLTPVSGITPTDINVCSTTVEPPVNATPDFTSAIPIGFGQHTIGSLNSTTQEDVYSINAQAGESLVLLFNYTFVQSESPPETTVFNNKGDVIRTSMTRSGIIDTTLPTAGVYYLVLRYPQLLRPAPYDFSIQSRTSPAPVSVLMPGDTVDMLLRGRADIALYAFDAEVNDAFDVTVTSDGQTDQRLFVAIWDNSGQVWNSGRGRAGLTVFTGGRFYVWVRSREQQIEGNFKLNFVQRGG